MRKLLLSFCIVFSYLGSAVLSPAAVGPNTAWAIQASATAGNNNSGGFDWGNANFATDLTCTSATGNSPTCSSVSYSFVAADAGDWLFIQSGTNWFNSAAGNTATGGNGCWYPISSVSGGNAVINAAVGVAICTNQNAGYPSPSFQVSTTSGIASVASPTAGVWSVDYTQVDVAQFSAADLVSTGLTTLTSSSKPFGINQVGNIIHILSGTGYSAGWYEIVSVSGSTATVDRSFGSSGLSGGTFIVGGAISLQSSAANQTDNNFLSGLHITAGNRIFMKAGTYLGAVTTAISNGTVSAPLIIEGFNVIRGDSPTGTNRPLWSLGTFALTAGSQNNFYNVSLLGSGSPTLTVATNCVLVNNKIVNNSTSNRVAVAWSGNGIVMLGNEVTSYHSAAISTSTYTGAISGNWIRDSSVGATVNATSSGLTITRNIFDSNIVAALQVTSSNTFPEFISQNTIFGTLNKTASGNGIWASVAANTVTALVIQNNILSGFSGTAVINAATNQNPDVYATLNDFFNNTADTSGFAKSTNTLSVDPQFVNVGQVVGSAATTLTGNKIQDTSKNFTSLGVVPNQDYVYLISGTGITAGKFAITAISTTTNPNDTLTVDLTLTANATADKVYQITTGHNFALKPGSGVRGLTIAFPGAFSTGYLDLGAIQSQGTGGQVGYAQ